MKRLIYTITAIFITIIYFSACRLKQPSEVSVPAQPTVSEAEQQLIKIPTNDSITEKKSPIWGNQTYGLTESSVFYDSPNGEKIINPASGKYLIGIHYITAGTDCKIQIFEIENEWAKVQVVVPDYLSDTHVGWIKTKTIEGSGFASPISVSNDSFKIIKLEKVGSIENIFVEYNGEDLSSGAMKALVSKIRSDTGSANIYVFGNKQVIELFDSASESKNEYILVADNFICMSPFDMPSAVMMYPYQDIQYKEYGGNNWKIDPIL